MRRAVHVAGGACDLVGVALEVGAQQVVTDLIFIIAGRRGFGDMVRISGGPSTDGATGVIEDVTLGTRLRISTVVRSPFLWPSRPYTRSSGRLP